MPTNILLVDDDYRLLRSLTRELSELDYDVTTTVSACEAGGALASGEYQVVVSDYQMNGTSGLSFLNSVKRDYPHVARILLSGKVTWNQIKETELRQIAHAVIQKPCKIEAIDQSIRDSIKKVQEQAETEEPKSLVGSLTRKLIGWGNKG